MTLQSKIIYAWHANNNLCMTHKMHGIMQCFSIHHAAKWDSNTTRIPKLRLNPWLKGWFFFHKLLTMQQTEHAGGFSYWSLKQDYFIMDTTMKIKCWLPSGSNTHVLYSKKPYVWGLSLQKLYSRQKLDWTKLRK